MEHISHITKGSIFDELGPAERALRKIKSDLWRLVVDEIERRGLTREATSSLLNIQMHDVVDLIKGRVSRFSEDQLLSFSSLLKIDVKLEQ